MISYVYIIKSKKDGKFYTGLTNNWNRRLKEHNIGKINTLSTLNRGPFKLVHLEECSDRIKAREREKFWKSGIGRELRDKMTSN